MSPKSKVCWSLDRGEICGWIWLSGVLGCFTSYSWSIQRLLGIDGVCWWRVTNSIPFAFRKAMLHEIMLQAHIWTKKGLRAVSLNLIRHRRKQHTRWSLISWKTCSSTTIGLRCSDASTRSWVDSTRTFLIGWTGEIFGKTNVGNQSLKPNMASALKEGLLTFLMNMIHDQNVYLWNGWTCSSTLNSQTFPFFAHLRKKTCCPFLRFQNGDQCTERRRCALHSGLQWSCKSWVSLHPIFSILGPVWYMYWHFFVREAVEQTNHPHFRDVKHDIY